ncbi:MAG: hypothetical protein Kow0068_08640 [Marinilabiliales bacterium]
MRLLKYVYKYFFKYILIIILFYALAPLTITPFYKFPQPQLFKGDSLYNPYSDINKGKWYKGNFQIQTKSWGGLTDGSKSPVDEAYDLYHSLGYDILAISDYQKINTYNSGSESYVPTYEHGYNTFKTHMVCICASKVNWWDYVLYHTINTKQFIINLLRDDCRTLVLAHPAFANAYYVDDMKYLSNYNCIEVFNKQAYSVEYWDTALSTGHPAFLIANDDSHDINNTNANGVVITYLNMSELNQNNITNALNTGRTYAFLPYVPHNESYEVRKKKMKDYAKLLDFTVKHEKISLKLSKKAKEIRFVGQNGEVKQIVENKKNADYKFLASDTYIRTEIVFENKDEMYLNPVFRYKSDPLKMPEVKINVFKTILYRLGLIILLVIAYVVLKKYLLIRKATKKTK